jgi:hypothetical protein
MVLVRCAEVDERVHTGVALPPRLKLYNAVPTQP